MSIMLYLLRIHENNRLSKEKEITVTGTRIYSSNRRFNKPKSKPKENKNKSKPKRKLLQHIFRHLEFEKSH